MLSKFAASRPLSWFALLLFLLVSFPGCQRFTIQHKPAKGEAAAEPLSIVVHTFQKQAHRHHREPLREGLVTSLLYEKQGRWQVIGRSAKGSWSLSPLVPGKYKISVAGLVAPDGSLEQISGPHSKSFTLAEGQAAYVDVVVKRIPTGIKVVIAITIVAVLLLIIIAILEGGGDVDVGDVADAVLLLPRLVITYADVWIHVLEALPNLPPPPLGYDPGRDEEDEDYDASAPHIESYSPAHGSKDVPRSADVRIQFDKPMLAWTLSPNTIYMEGSVSGPIVRGVEYEQEDFTMIVDPIRDLAPGETVTVSIYGEGIASDKGETMDENYRFEFQVAP